MTTTTREMTVSFKQQQLQQEREASLIMILHTVQLWIGFWKEVKKRENRLLLQDKKKTILHGSWIQWATSNQTLEDLGLCMWMYVSIARPSRWTPCGQFPCNVTSSNRCLLGQLPTCTLRDKKWQEWCNKTSALGRKFPREELDLV